MKKPVRIQRTRQHPYINPNKLEIVYVGRPSKWGNPYKTAKEFEMYRVDNKLDRTITSDLIKKELKGKNLACWCPLDQPCHADILLEIANK